MSSDNIKLHRFMLTFLASFKGPNGNTGIKYTNVTVSRNQKALPLGHIKQSQDSVAMQLQFLGVDAENIIDVTFMNSSYLGLMTEREFTDGLTESQKDAATLFENEKPMAPTRVRPNQFDS